MFKGLQPLPILEPPFCGSFAGMSCALLCIVVQIEQRTHR